MSRSALSRRDRPSCFIRAIWSSAADGLLKRREEPPSINRTIIHTAARQADRRGSPVALEYSWPAQLQATKQSGSRRALLQRHDCRMQFPERGNLRSATGVGIILEGESQNLCRQRRINFLSSIVNNHAMGIQLGGQAVAGGAEAIHVRRFHNHARGVLVRSGRNLHVHVTVATNQPRELHKGVPDRLEVELTPASRA